MPAYTAKPHGVARSALAHSAAIAKLARAERATHGKGASMKMGRITIACSAFALASLVAATTQAAPTFAPPPPTAPHLKTYSNWGALWWIWAVGTPAANNPVLDTTGANCAVGQPVPGTFFLAGTFDGSTV